jgi:HK97 family phage portal protein
VVITPLNSQQPSKRPSAKKSSPGAVAVFSNYGGYFQTAKDYAHAIKGWTYACVMERAQAVGELDLKVYRDDMIRQQAGKEELPTQHWLVQLLNEPNPFMTREELFQLTSMWCDVNGNAYWWTPTYGKATPQELWLLPSSSVTMITGSTVEEGAIKGYLYHSARGQMPIDASEICHIRNPRLDQDAFKTYFLGRSLVEAAFDAVSVDASVMSYLKSWYDNGAMPGLGVLSPGVMDDTQWQTFKQRFEETYRGAKNAGKMILLDGGKTLAPIATSGADQQLANIDLGNRDRICSVFGVPEPLLTAKHQNRATSETTEFVFYSRTVKRLANRYYAAASRHFRQFEAGIALQASERQNTDPAEQRAEQIHRITYGLTTINEEREKLGLDPIDGGDIPRIVAGLESLTQVEKAEAQQEVAVEQGTQQIDHAERSKEQEEADKEVGEERTEEDRELQREKHDVEIEQAKRDLKAPPAKKKSFAERAFVASPPSMNAADPIVAPAGAWSEDRTVAYWKKYDRKIIKGEPLILRGVRKWLRELGAHITREIAHKGIDEYVTKSARIVTKGTPLEEMPDLFDAVEWGERLEQIVGRDVATVLTDALHSAVEELGENWENTTSAFDKAVQKAISETTKRMTKSALSLKREIAATIYEFRDLPVAQISELLMERFETLTAGRAKMIARTASTSAVNRGQITAWEGLGVEYVWLTQRDGKVRDTHRAMDGLPPEADGLFRLPGGSGPHPGAIDSAAESANCFTEGTMVAGADTLGAYRALYVGDLVTIRTAAGRTLTGTPNHPILTDRGFVPLSQLTQSDNLVCYDFDQRVSGSHPYGERVPAPIEEVFSALQEAGLSHRIAATDVDFYGDRPAGDVDVVRADRLLCDARQAASAEPLDDLGLADTDMTHALSFGDGASAHLDGGAGLPAQRFKGVCGQLSTALGIHPREADDVRSADVADGDARVSKASTDSCTTTADALRDALLALSGEVSFDNVLDIEVKPMMRCHVYTLETVTGIYAAEGILTKNCRCVLRPRGRLRL